MIQRERQITYYLDQVQEGPVILHEDGSVGTIRQENISQTVEVPGRRPDRMREVTRTGSVLAETAMKASMREYIGSREKPTQYQSYGRDYNWEIEDFPDDVQARYRLWAENPRFLINEIRVAATDMQATESKLSEEMIPCPYCSSDTSYACRASGWDREFYRYPGMDLLVEGEHYIVPVDIAKVTSMNPDALDYEIEYYADPKNQTLQATRWLVFHVDAIPSKYINDQVEGYALLDMSDKVRGDIKVPVDHWSENGQEVRQRQGRDNSLEAHSPNMDASGYVVAIQDELAVRASDRRERQDYNELYKKLTQALGSCGMNLMYEFKYMGMGESGVVMVGKKPIGDSNQYEQITELYLGSPIDARDGVVTALATVRKLTNH